MSLAAPAQLASSAAIVDSLAGRLAALCAALGFHEESITIAVRVFRDVVIPATRLAHFGVGRRNWASEVSDDHTPIEFSVTLSPASAEVRVLFEPQGEAGTIASHRDAALRAHDDWVERYGIDVGRFRRIQHLFAPSDMQGHFALWSAIVFADGQAPAFKTYFNPQARGIAASPSLVEEGLRRLGLAHAWPRLASICARRAPHLDELKYFALDLTAGEESRVKIYMRHHDAMPDQLEAVVMEAVDARPSEAAEFAIAMGGGWRCFSERAPFTCAAFTGGCGVRPSSVTLYIPVCAYARDDREVEQRVSAYMVDRGMDDRPYRRVLAAFAKRPLADGVGMQSWIAFRSARGIPRLTVYLGSELCRVFPPGTVPAPTRPPMSFDSP